MGRKADNGLKPALVCTATVLLRVFRPPRAIIAPAQASPFTRRLSSVVWIILFILFAFWAGRIGRGTSSASIKLLSDTRCAPFGGFYPQRSSAPTQSFAKAAGMCATQARRYSSWQAKFSRGDATADPCCNACVDNAATSTGSASPATQTGVSEGGTG